MSGSVRRGTEPITKIGNLIGKPPTAADFCGKVSITRELAHGLVHIGFIGMQIFITPATIALPL